MIKQWIKAIIGDCVKSDEKALHLKYNEGYAAGKAEGFRIMKKHFEWDLEKDFPVMFELLNTPLVNVPTPQPGTPEYDRLPMFTYIGAGEVIVDVPEHIMKIYMDTITSHVKSPRRMKPSDVFPERLEEEKKAEKRAEENRAWVEAILEKHAKKED